MRVIQLTTEDDEISQDTSIHEANFLMERNTLRIICSGQALGIGDSKVQFKVVDGKKITCDRCLEIINHYKKLKV